MKIFEVLIPSSQQQLIYDFPDDQYETLGFLRSRLPDFCKLELIISPLESYRVSNQTEPFRSALLRAASDQSKSGIDMEAVILLPSDAIVSASSRPQIEASVGSGNLVWTELIAVKGTRNAVNIFSDLWAEIVPQRLVSPLLVALNSTYRYAGH
jgi:hypothetical protein